MDDAADPPVEGVDVAGLREYLADAEVRFAILFGSRARGTAEASSDVDVAVLFPGWMDDHERFHRRNRIDAELQAYADGFVDVSDLEALPTHVAYAALRDGVVLAGDERAVAEYRDRIERDYESEAGERDRDRTAFIDRLAEGDV